MNADTGRIFTLPEALDARVGEKLTEERLAAMVAAGDLVDDVKLDVEAALEEVRRGETIVAVSGEVAHAQEVGRRELDRRQRRRKARRS